MGHGIMTQRSTPLSPIFTDDDLKKMGQLFILNKIIKKDFVSILNDITRTL